MMFYKKQGSNIYSDLFKGHGTRQYQEVLGELTGLWLETTSEHPAVSSAAVFCWKCLFLTSQSYWEAAR